MKQVLVLGGSGFIGSAILDQLLLEGTYQVTALQHNKPVYRKHRKNLSVIEGTLSSLNLKRLQHKPDIIIHCARNSSGRFGAIGRSVAATKGKIANRNLLRQVQELDHPVQLLYLSGSLMYGDHGTEPVTENTPLSPISYAKEYINAELPFVPASLYNSGITMLRVPWVIGNGSWFKWFYMDYMQRTGTVPIYGNENAVMTFISVADVARSAVKLCVLKQLPSQLNLFHPQYLKQIEFAELLSHITQLPVKPLDSIAQQKMTAAAREAFEASICLSSAYPELQMELQQDMQSPEQAVKHALGM